MCVHVCVYMRLHIYYMHLLSSRYQTHTHTHTPHTQQGPNTRMMPNGCVWVPANLLFLSNFTPFSGCAGYTWSLSVQGQFYFIFPLLVKVFGRRRKLVYISILGIVCSTLCRVLTFYSSDEMLKPSTFYPWDEADLANYVFMFHVAYAPTWNRWGTLCWGVLLAALVADQTRHANANANTKDKTKDKANINADDNPVATSSNQVAEVSHIPYLRKHTFVHMALFGTACLVIYNLAYIRPHVFYFAFCYVGSPILAISICYIIYTAMYRIGYIGQMLNKLLSMPVWVPFSKASYFAFMLHPALMTLFYSTILYLPQKTPFAYVQYACIFLFLSYSIAWFEYNFFEKPIVKFLSLKKKKIVSKVKTD